MKGDPVCPYCGNDHPPAIAGSVQRGVYDGVLWWECLKCGGAWHRWTRVYTRLYLAAYDCIGDGRHPTDPRGVE